MRFTRGLKGSLTVMNSEEQRLLSVIGLCAKAGKLIFGTDRICEELRAAKCPPLAVIEASGNSVNTSKRLKDRCAYYGIAHYVIASDALALGYAIGKKKPVAAVGITDKGLLEAVLRKLPMGNGNIQ